MNNKEIQNILEEILDEIEKDRNTLGSLIFNPYVYANDKINKIMKRINEINTETN